MALMTSFVYTAAAQSPTCPPDQYWNGSQCVSNQPPPTYSPPPTNSPPPTCPPDQYWDYAAQQCKPFNNSPPPSQNAQPSCAPDQYWDFNKQQCVSANQPPPTYSQPPTYSASPTCPPDQYWDYGRQACVQGGAPPPNPCPEGQYWDYGRQACASGSPGPAQPCGPDQYWDPGKQTCVQGGGMAPPQCGPDQYWDYQMQQCASGRPPPPPGCTQDGYCPPPPQQSCPPGDPYCRPPPPPECGSKMEGLRSEMESLFNEFHTSMKTFHDSFEASRQEFGQGQHSSEEWRAWGEEWRIKGENIGKEFEAKMRAFAESKGLGDCAQYLPPPPMMAMGPGPGGDQGPRNYEQMRGPPPDSRFQQEDEAVRQIRLECEAQAKEILGEYWREPSQGPRYQGPSGPGPYPSGSPPPGGFPSGSPPPGGQYPSGPGPYGPGPSGGPSREQMEQVHQIMRDCEKKIRAHFEQVYKEEDFEGDADKAFGSFEMYFDEEANEIRVVGKYLALVGNPDSQVMSEVTCGGQQFIDQLKANGYLENFDFEQTGQGTALQVKASGSTILQIHDNPRCVINLATGGTVTELTLDLADYLELEEDESGVSFTDGEVDGKILLHDGELEVSDGNVVVLKSKATFLVSNGVAAQASGSSLAKDLNVKKALEDGNIGAEIVLAGNDDEFKSDSTPYGDMDINVTKDEGQIDIIVDKEEPEGKTIVIDIDSDVMSIDTIGEVQVDIHEYVNATEADFCANESSDLQDVLDPSNDDDCAEYWVVLDKNGVHVLVSLPHFSAKKIEIMSTSSGDGGFLGVPSPGIVGATLAAIAAIGLVGIGLRRKD